MATTANEPAFSAGVPENGFYYPGLTKRELFAMAAMQGIISQHLPGAYKQGDADYLALQSVMIADTVLAELSKPQP